MGVSKPCPFCGSHDTTVVWDRAGDDPFFVRLPGACEVLVRVRCLRCGAEGPTFSVEIEPPLRDGETYYHPSVFGEAARLWDERKEG